MYTGKTKREEPNNLHRFLGHHRRIENRSFVPNQRKQRKEGYYLLAGSWWVERGKYNWLYPNNRQLHYDLFRGRKQESEIARVEFISLIRKGIYREGERGGMVDVKDN